MGGRRQRGAGGHVAPLPSDHLARLITTFVDTCRNCGVELPAGARFCPNCGAPVPRELGDEPPAAARRRRLSNIAFAVLVGLNLLVIAFAVLIFGFGLFFDT